MHATGCGMLYMSSCCTCHHVLHVIMLYMSSCCICHHVVRVIMFYMCYVNMCKGMVCVSAVDYIIQYYAYYTHAVFF